jgi:hypothetical protein
MADTDRLKVGHSADDRDDDLLHLILLPEEAPLLTLAEQVLEVGPAVHVLTDHSDPVSVVHGFIEVVPVELKDIWVTLHLAQLDCFFL